MTRILLFLLGFCLYGAPRLLAQIDDAGLANAVVTGCISNSATVPEGIIPYREGFPGGEPVCGGRAGFRITPGDGAETITTLVDDYGNTIKVVITVDAVCGEVVTWYASENVVVDQVFMKGGTDQNVYVYTGKNPRPSSDGNLHCPTNSSGKFAGISHIDFCYHYRLTVTKTAKTEYKRTYNWTIDKQCKGPATLTLSQNQTYDYPFAWVVNAKGTDSEHKVTGTITVVNNTPYPTTVTSVSDKLSGGQVGTVSCSEGLPKTLAPGASFACDYTVNVAAAYDGVNTATVATSTPNVEGDSGTANFAFGNPTALEDDCVTVSDDCQTSKVLCANGTSLTYTSTTMYTCPIKYSDCGQYTYTNTARFVTDDTGKTGSDNCNVAVKIDCVTGCALTIGYWKTHSRYGPAPYDDAWALKGESTPFFLSGHTWYSVTQVAPMGNAYYLLSAQYVAATLNQLNGATVPAAVQTAWNTATTLFNTFTPAQIGALSRSSTLRAQFVSLASTLDGYNNGLAGVPHCSESKVATSAERTEPAHLVLASLRLTPNPAHTEATIYLDRAPDKGDVIVMDALGRQVKRLPLTTAQEVLTFSVHDLSSGIYQVALYTREGALVAQTKMVISH